MYWFEFVANSIHLIFFILLETLENFHVLTKVNFLLWAPGLFGKSILAFHVILWKTWPNLCNFGWSLMWLVWIVTRTTHCLDYWNWHLNTLKYVVSKAVTTQHVLVSVCATLQFTYVNTYPDEPPVIEVPLFEGMDNSDAEGLREYLEQEVMHFCLQR